MPTGVHDGHIAAEIVFCAYSAGIGEACCFFDRKYIEFSAKHDSGASAVLKYGNNAGAADPFGNVVARGSKTPRQFRCSLRFVRRQFRILVQIKIEGVCIPKYGVDFIRR